MKKNRKLRVIVLVILLIALASFGAWRYLQPSLAASNSFTASGTVESTSIRLSPEVSGVVTELDFSEGQEVKKGQVLAKINDATAQTQYTQIKASLQSAQENLALAEANYALVSANNTAEQHQSTLSAAELEVVNARQALQSLTDNAPITTASLLQQIAVAAKNLDKANDHVESIKGQSDPQDIERAKANVVITKDALKKAHEDYDRVIKYSDKNVSRAYLQIKVANAQEAYDHAVTLLSNLLGHANELDLAVAEADAKVAEAQRADAKRRYDQLVNGIDPNALELAQAHLNAAEAKLAAIQADPGAKQLAVAQDQVDVAKSQVANMQAQLEALEIQLDKYVMTAPEDGIVLSRGVEIGETVGPGSILFEIGPLQKLLLTVYLPEEKFGTVIPGDEASVKVDAYPDRTFTARVDRLSDKAEFTPRNVQTVEGRRDTVFAIYLSLDNSDMALMPGMWADVTFSSQ